MTEMNGRTSKRARSRSKSALVFEFERDGEQHRVKLRRDVEPGNAHDIPVLTQVSTTARTYDDPIPTLPLPGSGETNDDCGKAIPALLCPTRGCGKVYEPGRTCRRSRCPRCWQSWAFQRAVQRGAQLESLARTRGADNPRVKLHHLTCSFRPSTRFNSCQPLDRAIEVVKQLALMVAMDTGVLIYHPYRIAMASRGDVTGHPAGAGDLTWPDIFEKIEDDRWDWDAVQTEFLSYHPHFHIIGLADYVQTATVGPDIEAKSGVVLHRITEDSSAVSIYDLEALCRAMAYSISHAGLRRNDENESWTAVIRPFGQVANFSAYSNVMAETKATMREVAHDVLGVAFPEPRCSAVDDDEAAPTNHTHDHDGCGCHHASASKSDSATPQAANRRGDGDSDTTEARKGYHTRLVPMWRGTEYTGDTEWMEALDPDQREWVRQKVAEWEDQ